jgi:hypothetical protein
LYQNELFLQKDWYTSLNNGMQSCPPFLVVNGGEKRWEALQAENNWILALGFSQALLPIGAHSVTVSQE